MRRNWLDLEPRGRAFCWDCRKPKSVCYCGLVKPFAPKIEFVILIHPEEARRHIASARMAHLNLSNSHFLVGEDFSEDRRLAKLLNDESRSHWLLYPGESAIALHEDGCASEYWQTVGPSNQATVYVIDGTWRKVGRMVASRPELLGLRRLAFQPPHPSRFQIRKQPAAYCWSTLEAISYIIERTNAAELSDANVLQNCFLSMVEQQIEFETRDSL